MRENYDEALDYSQRWIELIHKPSLPEAEAKAVIEESKYNFAEHFNKGWLDYRKSVTEAGDWAAVEWTGSGAIFRDILGREYIDCLGGYGLMDLGWSHPEVVRTVRAQLGRHADAQPGADRPAARRAGAPAGANHPRRYQVQLVLRLGHRDHRSRAQGRQDVHPPEWLYRGG